MATTTSLGFRIPSADGSDQIAELEEWFRNLGNDVDGYLANTLGSWATYTPTTTGITVGNGAVSGAYTRIGKTVIFAATFTLGSTSGVTGTISFTLPFTAANAAWPGIGQLIDTGSDYYAVIVNPTTTVGQLFAMSTAGAYASIAVPSATVPFTWTTGDVIRLSGFFQAA